MTFPDTPLDLRAELDLNGAWTDISAYLDHGPVTIARGHPDESVTVSASTLAMTLTNSDGRFTSRNPVGAYYPYLMRNVPCRVSIPAQVNYLRLENDAASYASCPDSAGLHITGDIDIRLDVQLTGYQACTIAAKWPAAAGQQCWLLKLGNDGTLQFFWSTTGSDFPGGQSTASLPLAGRQAVRVTLAVATGTVTFYTGPAGGADGSTWTQLGAAVVTGATSIFAGTAPVTAGNRAVGSNGMAGNLYELEVRSGIAGTVKAHPVFSSQTAGTTSFADAQSNTWTLTGTAEISSRNYRGHAEVPEWPQEQSALTATTTPSVLVAASGGGLLRRLSQRNNPLSSAMYRAWTRVTASVLAAYWPMEDGTHATRIASGNGGQPMYFGGTGTTLPQLAANSDFACSGPLPVVNGSAFSGSVSYSGTWTDNQVAFLLEIPAAAEPDLAVITSVYTTGTVALLTLRYRTAGSGSLELFGYDSAGTQLFDSGAVGFAVNGKQMLIAVSLQNAGGGNITWHIDGFAAGAASPTGLSGTVAGTVGAVTRVAPNRDGTLTQTVTGHCAVLTAYQQLYSLFAYVNPYGQLTGALNAWAAEPAGIRFARLCSEEGIAFRGAGNLNGTVLMGPQTAQPLAQLLQECADADRGVWYEPRQVLGFGYIARSALYNQAAAVTFDYLQNHLGMWSPGPTEDDQVIVNDATVSQTSGGSSARQFAAPGQPVTGGRLSTLSPPLGAGTYDQDYQLNLYGAGGLDSEASWIVHLGTVDQQRFPGIVLDLTNRDLASLFQASLGMDLGARLVISNPPAQWGPDPVSQLAQQLTETLWYDTLTIAVAGVPELPYEVAGAGTAHADTAGSQLHTSYSAAATPLSVDVTAGSLWTTAQADFPFDVMVAGERMTVTDISGPPGNFLATAASGSVQNAGFEGGIGTWTATGAVTAVAASSAQAHSGAGSMAMTATGAGAVSASHCTAGNILTQGLPCAAGDSVACSAWLLAATVGRSCQVGAAFYTSGGVLIGAGPVLGTASADVTAGWTKIASTVTAPATAAFARLWVQVNSAAGAGELHYADDCALGDVTTGAAATQSFTVTRSVNGVVKAQASAAAVNVYPSPAAAL